eukprot:3627064-Rhodomonas_salina.1
MAEQGGWMSRTIASGHGKSVPGTALCGCIRGGKAHASHNPSRAQSHSRCPEGRQPQASPWTRN